MQGFLQNNIDAGWTPPPKRVEEENIDVATACKKIPQCGLTSALLYVMDTTTILLLSTHGHLLVSVSSYTMAHQCCHSERKLCKKIPPWTDVSSHVMDKTTIFFFPTQGFARVRQFLHHGTSMLTVKGVFCR